MLWVVWADTIQQTSVQGPYIFKRRLVTACFVLAIVYQSRDTLYPSQYLCTKLTFSNQMNALSGYLIVVTYHIRTLIFLYPNFKTFRYFFMNPCPPDDRVKTIRVLIVLIFGQRAHSHVPVTTTMKEPYLQKKNNSKK